MTSTQCTRRFARTALGCSLALMLAGTAFAQYTGSTGTTGSPSYGSGKTIAIGVGAAAVVGGGVAYLMLHRSGSVTGCVQTTGAALRLVSDNKKDTYLLMRGDADVKPGEHVTLKGKKIKDSAGVKSFEATKVKKNLGSCEAGAVSAAAAAQ